MVGYSCRWKFQNLNVVSASSYPHFMSVVSILEDLKKGSKYLVVLNKNRVMHCKKLHLQIPLKIRANYESILLLGVHKGDLYLIEYDLSLNKKKILNIGRVRNINSATLYVTSSYVLVTNNGYAMIFDARTLKLYQRFEEIYSPACLIQ
jgi:hypothetical protein